MKNFTTIALVAAFTFIPSLTFSGDQSEKTSKNLAAQEYAKNLSRIQSKAIQEGLSIAACSTVSLLPYPYIGFLTLAKEITPSTLKTVFKKSVALSAVSGAAFGAFYTYDKLETWKEWHEPK